MPDDRRSVSLDSVMRTFGALLLAITTGMSSWALLQIVELRERVARQEVRVDESKQLLVQIRSDLNEMRTLILEIKK
jgi:uncharacterized membrane protein